MKDNDAVGLGNEVEPIQTMGVLSYLFMRLYASFT